MPDYNVTLESAWIIKDVKTLDDAIGIAISEAGKRLNPQAKFVEVEAGMLACPFCEGELNSAIVVADTALVGLLLDMKVFRAESSEHASRIAKSTIGKALRDIPLQVKDVQELNETLPTEQKKPKKERSGQKKSYLPETDVRGEKNKRERINRDMDEEGL
ncbi:MAG: DUF555 domain-containing protein [Methanomicrobiales archaeon]|nr:DUF555 domain-containing protein [Methanomicrobiales archaeon]